MSERYLTKSDFKVAQTCAAKLYYRKLGYPTTLEGDDYLSLLAEGGYLVEALARAQFPEGIAIPYTQGIEAAIKATQEALQMGRSTLFEATFLSRGKLARVDILTRQDNILELIEIKARAFDTAENRLRLAERKPNLFRNGKNGQNIESGWRPYLEDVAFQYLVLQEVFPDSRIIPFLMMPDKSALCPIDRSGLSIRLLHVPDPVTSLQETKAEFIGDVDALLRAGLVVKVDVTSEVEQLLPSVRESVGLFLATLRPELTRAPAQIGAHCCKCEYRTQQDGPNGFRECWGKAADASPHFLDLYRVGNMPGSLFDDLIASGSVRLMDIPEERLLRQDGTVGSVGRRQRIQITHTRNNREWYSDELGDILRSFAFPLHFVDFETCGPVMPPYAGLGPYETVAFQWSCHTLDNPRAEPRHAEWIQTADRFPNPEFAASLYQHLGDAGTVLMWARHEASVLRTIRQQMQARGAGDEVLSAWLERMIGSDGLVDMNDLTLNHYFHPIMGGRTSIKVVVEAIWHANPGLRERLPQYVMVDGDRLLSPYKTLPPLIINGRSTSVSEGTGAILAYEAMMGRNSDDRVTDEEERLKWRRLLQQYCELDTLSMVMVWWHWCELTGYVE